MELGGDSVQKACIGSLKHKQRENRPLVDAQALIELGGLSV